MLNTACNFDSCLHDVFFWKYGLMVRPHSILFKGATFTHMIGVVQGESIHWDHRIQLHITISKLSHTLFFALDVCSFNRRDGRADLWC